MLRLRRSAKSSIALLLAGTMSFAFMLPAVAQDDNGRHHGRRGEHSRGNDAQPQAPQNPPAPQAAPQAQQNFQERRQRFAEQNRGGDRQEWRGRRDQAQPQVPAPAPQAAPPAQQNFQERRERFAERNWGDRGEGRGLRFQQAQPAPQVQPAPQQQQRNYAERRNFDRRGDYTQRQAPAPQQQYTQRDDRRFDRGGDRRDLNRSDDHRTFNRGDFGRGYGQRYTPPRQQWSWHNDRRWTQPRHSIAIRHRAYAPPYYRSYYLPRERWYRNIYVYRPFGFAYPGFGYYYTDDDAYRWLGLAALSYIAFNDLNEMQQRAHEEALIEATQADIGERIYWDEGGISGSVMATRDGETADGRPCREFQQEVIIGGRREQAYGTACMQPDGSWQVVNDE